MIYLDHNATTLMHHDVVALMSDVLKRPLNPSSSHSYGRLARSIVEHAREQIAKLLAIDLSLKQHQIIFTATGTEANNLLMTNFADADLFVSAVEHSSILKQKELGCSNVHLIPVDTDGIVDLEHLERLLANSQTDKKLISIMLANNETGVINSLSTVCELAVKYNAFVHSDCSQAVGKIDVSVTQLRLDFVTISSHKFGGPIGAAALIATTKLHLQPCIIGGGQEYGLRSGTENVAAIAGFGLAAECCMQELPKRRHKMAHLQQILEHSLCKSLSVQIIGANVQRLPNTSLISIEGMDTAALVIALDMRGIAVSAGAACFSTKIGQSHVLKAMKIDNSAEKGVIRISNSYHNTEDEIYHLVNALEDICLKKAMLKAS